MSYGATDAPVVPGSFITPLDADRNPDGLHIVTHGLGDSWLAAYYIDTRSGRPAIIEVRIVPRDGLFTEHPRDDHDPAGAFESIDAHEPRRDRVERPLTARTLQQLRPGSAIAELLDVATQTSLISRAEIGVSREMLRARPARGRRDRGARDLWLARVAVVYVAATDKGSISPVRDTRDVLNEATPDAPLSPNAVRDLLKAARGEGLLERPTPGKRQGGRLTPKAEQLLAASE